MKSPLSETRPANPLICRRDYHLPQTEKHALQNAEAAPWQALTVPPRRQKNRTRRQIPAGPGKNRSIPLIENFKNILEIIAKARSVVFVAVGNTIPVAIDGAFKFNQIGKLALSSTIWETQIGYVCNLTRDDVVIAISNSGESSSVVISLETAKEQGATTISITNNEESTVASVSDYHITTATREKLFLDGYCFSRVTATAVIEILYLFLTSMNEQAYVNIAKHENKIAGDKL